MQLTTTTETAHIYAGILVQRTLAASDVEPHTSFQQENRPSVSSSGHQPMTLFRTNLNSSRELHFESLFSCLLHLVIEKAFCTWCFANICEWMLNSIRASLILSASVCYLQLCCILRNNWSSYAHELTWLVKLEVLLIEASIKHTRHLSKCLAYIHAIESGAERLGCLLKQKIHFHHL